MNITIIGAGAIGSAIARTLIAQPDVTNVQVCDAHARSLQELHVDLQSPKLRSFQVDARDINVIRHILESADCVIGCAAPHMNPMLAEVCLTLGIHFCDLGGNDDIVRQELALAERAREKSVWIVPNCGLSPGLVNILCLLGIEQFDKVDAALIRVGDLPLHPKPPFNFRIAWSAEKIIDDYTNPVQLIEDGKLSTCAPLSHLEEIRFENEFNNLEAFCTAGSLTTLATALAGKVKTLDHKTIRWPGHASQMQFLLGLGFGEPRIIDVRTHLTYRDVLIRRMRQRLDTEHDDAVLLRVLIQGKQGKKKRTLVYEMVERYNADEKLTAMKRCTSIPTAAVAALIASGRVAGGGAAPPEDVVPKEAFYNMVVEQGLDIKKTWYDGYVEVGHPGG